jgi:hypothetical protein
VFPSLRKKMTMTLAVDDRATKVAHVIAWIPLGDPIVDS